MNAHPGALAQIAALNKEEYQQNYLKNLSLLEWRQLRRLVLKRDRHLCRFCLIREATEVHHSTYSFGFFAPATYLVSLCVFCHGKWHKGWYGGTTHLPSANDNEPQESLPIETEKGKVA